jgi:heat shock protein HslJ
MPALQVEPDTVYNERTTFIGWEVSFMKKQVKLIALSMSILVLFVLTGCSITAGDALEGTSWVLTSLAGSPPLEGTTLTVEFSNGEIGGSSGCNSFGGTYEARRKKLEVGELMSTLMACTDTGVMDQEQAFIGYLQDSASYEVNDTELKIITTEGTELVFAPAK